jgi:hypothetical protein
VIAEQIPGFCEIAVILGGSNAGDHPELIHEVRLVEESAFECYLRPVNSVPTLHQHVDVVKTKDAAKEFWRQTNLGFEDRQKPSMAEDRLSGDFAYRGAHCATALVTASSRRPAEADARNATSSRRDLMTINNNRTKDEAAIQELIDGFVKAIRAKDIHGVMSVFAPEVVSFDLGPPLQHGGGEPFMKRWQELFDSYQNAIEIRGPRSQRHGKRRRGIQP